MMKLLSLCVSSIIIAVGLGTAFSLAYPTVEIDVSLGFLFMLIGLLLALVFFGAWQVIWRNKT